jgi:hypothetical protein
MVWMLWRREKYLVPVRSQTLAVQSVACHYTDWAIPALCLRVTCCFNLQVQVSVVRMQPHYTSRWQRRLSPDHWGAENMEPGAQNSIPLLDISIQVCCLLLQFLFTIPTSPSQNAISSSPPVDRSVDPSAYTVWLHPSQIHFDPEDETSTFLQNIAIHLQHYVVITTLTITI